ncbi:sugar transferase [Profundibacter sp.]|uniref:sugar transferase n=1 Tax=Profundibacter sp. TaxID=3101071 RepID=UPI003D118890
MKSVVDRLLALLLLGPAMFLCIPAMIAIRIESRGNPLFLQTRVGRNQKPFTLFKLRTMAHGTGDRGSHEVSAAQVTRIGQLLRRTKVDELPQIINVLIGNMSFVGPRPCLPNQSELIAERDARNVFSVLPGITGPAQLSGIDMSTPRELAIADAAYISERSLRMDLELCPKVGDAVIRRHVFPA